MRPIHALLLVVALVLVLLGGLFLVVREPVPSGVAGALPQAEAPPATPQPEPPPALVVSGDEREPDARSALEAVATPAVPPAAAGGSPRARFRLRGRVVAENGAPIAQAQVFAAPGVGMRELPLDVLDPKTMPWVQRSDAKTDADGRFEIALDAQSVLRLAVRAAGFAPHDAEHTISGAEQDLGDVPMAPSVVLEGRVVDSAGRGVAGAELRRVAEGGGMVMLGGLRGALLATCDGEGRFRADQLATGPWRILITSEAHPDKTESGEAERAGEVQAGLVFTLEDGSEVHGRVVGAPPELLSKLSIRASPRRGEGTDGAVAIRFDGGGPSPTSLFGGARRAPCRADGTFVLRGLRGNTTYRLVAREGEREFQAKTWTAPITARAGDRGVQLLFKPETALVFQVVDDVSGEPITELDVQAGFRWPMPLLDEGSRAVKSFPEGRVRFAPFPNRPDGGDAERAQVRIEALGYQGFERRDILLGDGQDTDLGQVRLKRAPKIEVTVLDDATGEPVVGARVVLEEERAEDGEHRMSFTIGSDGDDEGPRIGPGAAQRARTGADGVARVTSLPGKRGSLRVTSRDHAAWAGETRLLPLSEDLKETVRLRQGSTVVVEVVDADGRPVPRAAVEHELDGEAPEEVIRIGASDANQTDAQGRVVFAHLQAGLHRFRLGSAASSAGPMRMMRGRRAGGRNLPAAGGGAPWTELVVADGTSETLRLVAPARGRLVGRIEEAGLPLANATVRLSAQDDEAPELAMLMPGGPQARTDAKGRYEIEDVEEGEYRVTVAHSTRAMPHEAELRIREGENELDLDLPVAVVEGRVLDKEQKPVQGARVRAERALSGGGAGGPRFAMTAVMVMDDGGDSPEVTIGGPSGGESVRTDAEGRYRLRGVAPDVDLVVKVTSREHQPKGSETLRVRPDETLDKVDFELEAGGTIEVSVVRGDGQPGTACLVRARAESGGGDEPKTAVTNGSGSARLSGLKPGRWILSAEALGAGRGGAESVEQTVEVAVAKPQKVTLQVP